MITPEAVLQALEAVIVPELDGSVVRLGMVSRLEIQPDSVACELSWPLPLFKPRSPVIEACEKALLGLSGIRQAQIDLAVGIRGLPEKERKLPSVANVIAVASGKGGVGKSTLCLNLAVALAQAGARVGVLDADIYGPSIPQLAGHFQAPPVAERKIIPIEKHGIRFMSFGLIMKEAVIWRGAMIHAVLEQLIQEVNWGELDYLLVDLPPGTGDPPLTIAQLLSLSGVVIVSTPQDMALQIAAKSLEMFRQPDIGAEILGLVENMSEFECPDCHQRHTLFGRGQTEAMARRFGVSFLGRIPLVPEISLGGDEGEPILVRAPQSGQAQAIRNIARDLAVQVFKSVTKTRLRVI